MFYDSKKAGRGGNGCKRRFKISLRKHRHATRGRSERSDYPMNFRLGNGGEFLISVLTLHYTWSGQICRCGIGPHRHGKGVVYTSWPSTNLRRKPTKEVANGNTGASR